MKIFKKYRFQIATKSPAAGGNFLGFKMTKYIFVKEIQYFRGSNPENFPPYGGSNPENFPPAAGFSPPFGGAKPRFSPPGLRNMGGQKTVLPPLTSEIWGGKKIAPPGSRNMGGAKNFSPHFFADFFENLQKKSKHFFLKIQKKIADFFENLQIKIPKVSVSELHFVKQIKARRRRKFFRI